MVPEDQANGGACFGVGVLVGQVVIAGEALIVFRGANTPSNIQLSRGEVLPETLTYFAQRGVRQLSCQISHCAQEIHLAYSMADDLVLLSNGLMGLIIFIAPGPEMGRIISPRLGFEVKIVWLFSPFFNKILA